MGSNGEILGCKGGVPAPCNRGVPGFDAPRPRVTPRVQSDADRLEESSVISLFLLISESSVTTCGMGQAIQYEVNIYIYNTYSR